MQQSQRTHLAECLHGVLLWEIPGDSGCPSGFLKFYYFLPHIHVVPNGMQKTASQPVDGLLQLKVSGKHTEVTLKINSGPRVWLEQLEQ